MFPHELLNIALKGQRKAVADRLHVHVTLVDKWCNDPEESSNRNPLDRVIEITKKLREVSPDTSELIVQYMNEQLGYLPPIRLIPAAGDMEKLAKFVKEVGDYLTTTAEANTDGEHTIVECEEMRKQIRDVLTIASQIDVALGQEIERLQLKKGGGR